MNRRNFLRTSAVGGGLVWAAPAITTVVTASAASPGPCDPPPGACLSLAYGLSLVVPLLVNPLVFGDTGDCTADVHVGLGGGPLNLLRSATLCGLTSTNPCHSTGFAEGLRVKIPGLEVTASVLRAQAGTTGGTPDDCACSTAGSSTIVGLTINGRVITVGGEIPVNGGTHLDAPCNTHLLDIGPLLDVILNEQICTGDQLVVNALHIHSDVLGIDLIVGHAEAGRANSRVPDLRPRPLRQRLQLCSFGSRA